MSSEAVPVRSGSPVDPYQLGLDLERHGQLEAATDAYRAAAAADAGSFQARHRLGQVLQKLGELDEAEAALSRAHALDPRDKQCLRDLSSVHTRQGRPAEVVDGQRELVRLPNSTALEHSGLLFNLQYDARPSQEELFAEAVAYGDRVAAAAGPVSPPPLANDRSPDRRLRVGYITSDFREHPIGRLIEPVLAGHDRAAVEVFCYSDRDVAKADAATAHLRDLADVWRETQGVPDAAVAERIREDRIDVLVELNGHFGDNRLPMFIRRPAPVQVSHFGYCATTGAPGMDYRITDGFSDPPGETERFHTERLVRLDGASWCYQPWQPTPDVGPVPAPIRSYVTFGNLNNAVKTSDPAAAAWAAILRRVPRSRLMLLAPTGAEPYVARRFAAMGVDPARLVLVNGVPRETYSAMYGQCDIGLDPFPFNGDNTTCDALWMGVPVVALRGEAFRSRRGVSHLGNVGLPDLIAHSPAHYVEVAVQLAADLPRLEQLRQTLRGRLQTSPLGDAPAFLQRLERAYRQMWHEWCASRPA